MKAITKKNEPIIVFESVKQARKCLKMWKEILFLNDWNIDIDLQNRPLYNSAGVELEGTIFMTHETSCAKVIIKQPDEVIGDSIEKYCAEKILVHELLHTKINWLESPDNYEGKYVDIMEHRLLEQMAKSLIMARYNLPFSWFSNIVEEGEEDEE